MPKLVNCCFVGLALLVSVRLLSLLTKPMRDHTITFVVAVTVLVRKQSSSINFGKEKAIKRFVLWAICLCCEQFVCAVNDFLCCERFVGAASDLFVLWMIFYAVSDVLVLWIICWCCEQFVGAVIWFVCAVEWFVNAVSDLLVLWQLWATVTNCCAPWVQIHRQWHPQIESRLSIPLGFQTAERTYCMFSNSSPVNRTTVNRIVSELLRSN